MEKGLLPCMWAAGSSSGRHWGGHSTCSGGSLDAHSCACRAAGKHSRRGGWGQALQAHYQRRCSGWSRCGQEHGGCGHDGVGWDCVGAVLR